MDLGRVASVDISAIGAEGRDLELEIIFEDNNDPEMRADRVGAAKDLLHFLGTRIGRDIDVFWRSARRDRARSRRPSRRRTRRRGGARRTNARS